MKFIRKIQVSSSKLLSNFIKKGKKAVKNRVLPFIDRRPLISFFGLLILLVAVIALGNVFRAPKIEEEESKKEPKEVAVFGIGTPARMRVSGTVEKTGVIQIIAQTAGVVQKIAVTEGQAVSKGGSLFSLSSNYQGGNISSVSRAIAQKNVEVTEANYPIQKEMIGKRREIAEKTDSSADALRDISAKSIDETKHLISLNEEIISALDDQTEDLEAINVGGVNDSAIIQAKQAKSGALAALNGLKSQQRTVEYTSAGDKEPAKLSDLGRELTLKQLDVEEKSLELSVEIARLNLKIARITESLSYPSVPGPGVVEKIHVNVGQAVNPGTVLATITCDVNVAHVVVLISRDIKEKISRFEPSKVYISGSSHEILPRYISTEPLNGTLYQVIFTLPNDLGAQVGNRESVFVELPIGQVQSTASVPVIPIDAVFQTENSSLVYVATPSSSLTYEVMAKEVTLGNVLGSYVHVIDGLGKEDKIILDRSVIAGDAVTLKL